MILSHDDFMILILKKSEFKLSLRKPYSKGHFPVLARQKIRSQNYRIDIISLFFGKWKSRLYFQFDKL